MTKKKIVLVDDNPANLYLPHSFETTNTVVYTGTHDNDTTCGWYEKAGEKSKDYFHRYMNVDGKDASWDMIRLAYSTVAEQAVVPVQDVMALGGWVRMNTPGVAENNWQFRYTPDMLTERMAEGLWYLSGLYNRREMPEDEEDAEDTEDAEEERLT